MKDVSLVIRLKFKGGLRQGSLSGDLSRQNLSVMASTLWGALAWSADSLFGGDVAERMVREWRISSLLWAREDEYYVPMPCFVAEDQSSDEIKAIRKRLWISIDELKKVLSGEQLSDVMGPPLFESELSVSAALDRSTNAAVPYFRRRIVPKKKVEGIVVAVGPSDLEEKFKAAFRLMGDEGIGGERSSGWGVFDPTIMDADDTPFGSLLNNEGDRYLTLGVYVPTEDEIRNIKEDKDLTGYRILRLRGYVGTSDVIKPTVFCLDHGALLHFKPKGTIIDITPRGVDHPVLFNGMPPSIAVVSAR